MKHLLKTTLALAVATAFVACSGNDSGKSTKDSTAQDHSKMENMENNTGTSPVLKDDKLNAVYQHYIHLTTALTNSDMAEAKIAANAIEAGAKDLESGSSIASAAFKISSATNIEAQRAAYSDLSNQVISLVKKSGLSKGQLYVDYCPMALNDKGAYWLSNQKEIRNPYFGEKMLTCGEVKETLK